jgi:hypothetical protein
MSLWQALAGQHVDESIQVSPVGQRPEAVVPASSTPNDTERGNMKQNIEKSASPIWGNA